VNVSYGNKEELELLDASGLGSSEDKPV